MKKVENITMLRDILNEAAIELKVSPATQAKMAQKIVSKAAEGASRAELKMVAIDAGKVSAA
jgi:hypothetical protein